MDSTLLKEYFANKLDIHLTNEQANLIVQKLKQIPPQHRDGKTILSLIESAKKESLKEKKWNVDSLRIKRDINKLDNDVKTSVDTGDIDDILEQIKNTK